METNFDDLHEIISEQAKKLQLEKERLLTQRIIERATKGNQFSVEQEAKRMFPRIKCVQVSQSNTEQWYWNDGSVNGLHLITFYYDNDIRQDWTDVNKAPVFTMELKYK